MKKFFVMLCVISVSLSMYVLPAIAADELVYWEALHAGTAQKYQSLGDTPMYQELEKRTGVKIQHIDVSSAGDETRNQFNLVLASGDLPDMMFYANWIRHYPGAPTKLVEDGIALPLNDLIDEHAPNFKKLMEEHPEWRKAVTTDDGQYWCFPFLRGDPELMVFFGPILRKDFLDELGLAVPETIDEWHDTLTALKAKADYPLTMNAIGKGPRNITTGHTFIGAYKIQWDWYLGDDGKVHFGQYEPAYKDFLTTWNKWYSEGLIDPDFLTNERKQVDARMLNGKSAAMMGYGGSNIGRYLDGKADDPTFDLVGAPHPVLVKGDKPFTGQMDVPFNPNGVALVITTQAKDPVAAVKWADYAYSPDGKILFNFGIEGESFTWNENFPGFEGEKFPQYTDIMTANPEGISLANALKMWVRAGYHGPFVQDKRYIAQYYARQQQLDAWNVWSNSDAAKHKIPPTSMTPEESQEFADIMAQAETYVREKYAAFTLGQEALDDATFEKYREQLKKMGIERAIELKQLAYERYLNK